MSGIAGDYTKAIEVEKQAIGKLTADHWFLRGYFEACLADYLVAALKKDEAEQFLLAAIAEKHKSNPGTELKFHIANARLKLADLRLRQKSVKKREQAMKDVELAREILRDSPNDNSLNWALRLNSVLEE